jgi:hypothetical protein
VRRCSAFGFSASSRAVSAVRALVSSSTNIYSVQHQAGHFDRDHSRYLWFNFLRRSRFKEPLAPSSPRSGAGARTIRRWSNFHEEPPANVSPPPSISSCLQGLPPVPIRSPPDLWRADLKDRAVELNPEFTLPQISMPSLAGKSRRLLWRSVNVKNFGTFVPFCYSGALLHSESQP